jgi:hypothetical protein
MSVDLITEMTQTPRGYRHILHALEAFAGFSVTRALRSKEGREVAAALLDIFLTHGFPRRVRCDRGEVLSGPVQELLDWAGIETRATSSHHPQANGQNERGNTEIRRELARLGEEDDWDLALSTVTWFRNVRASRRADVSAYQLLYNVEPRLPMVANLVPGLAERVEEVEEEFTAAVRNEGRRRMGAAQIWRERMRAYEAGRSSWAAGQLVLVRNFGRKKGEPRWKGPYPVTEVRARSLRVRTDAGRDLVVNQSDVKPYRQVSRAAVVGEVATPPDRDMNMNMGPNIEADLSDHSGPESGPTPDNSDMAPAPQGRGAGSAPP